jgi:hypothetical protein
VQRLRWLTAGESHGPALVAILEGLPAGLPFAPADLERSLERRRLGHGRSPRMDLEADRFELLAGLRHGVTLGSPVDHPELLRHEHMVDVHGEAADRAPRAPRGLPPESAPRVAEAGVAQESSESRRARARVQVAEDDDRPPVTGPLRDLL